METQILELPEYHKLQQSTIKTGESIVIQPKDILIVEGTIALTLAREVKKIHRFFIEIDETVRRSRVIEEYLKRGKTQLQAESIYSERQIDESPVIMQSAYGSVHLNLMTLTEHP
jgi:pantothenate kinase